MSPRRARPFSRDRNGTVLGEGAAFVVLEHLNAHKRGASIYAELSGYGVCERCETHDAQPSIEGQVKAMELALSDANMCANSILIYVNAHGTGTILK